ncbi:MAG: peptidoglycan DD-metalloendopeptidase family protein [Halioglobus sp.]
MLARLILGLVLSGLLGCGSTTRAPVEDRSAQTQDAAYTVKRGDTLYSIAFRYGRDFRDVAAANGIAAPYTIYPGQKIALQTPAPSKTASAPPAVVHPAVPVSPGYPATQAPAPEPVSAPQPILQRPMPIYSPDEVNAAAPPRIAGTPAVIPSQPTVIEAGPTATPAPAPVPEVTATASPTKPPPADVAYTGSKIEAWRWPTSGPVTRGYSESVHKGIDIGGARGDPVVAVAAGKVVYAGTGIVGFGELLIVKHNDVYLSAYGHNEELLVSEGQTVAAGQTIAYKGNSGTDTVKLHFEIRKEGKPIDPQRLLPQR